MQAAELSAWGFYDLYPRIAAKARQSHSDGLSFVGVCGLPLPGVQTRSTALLRAKETAREVLPVFVVR